MRYHFGMADKAFDSSYIAGYSYDPVSKVLTVEHKKGKVYRYKGVSPSTFQDLENSASKGAFIASRIVGYYHELQ